MLRGRLTRQRIYGSAIYPQAIGVPELALAKASLMALFVDAGPRRQAGVKQLDQCARVYPTPAMLDMLNHFRLCRPQVYKGFLTDFQTKLP